MENVPWQGVISRNYLGAVAALVLIHVNKAGKTTPEL